MKLVSCEKLRTSRRRLEAGSECWPFIDTTPLGKPSSTQPPTVLSTLLVTNHLATGGGQYVSPQAHLGHEARRAPGSLDRRLQRSARRQAHPHLQQEGRRRVPATDTLDPPISSRGRVYLGRRA